MQSVQGSLPVTELPGIGGKTATRLEENHGIETAAELSVAFFGDEGKAVSETLYSPLKVLGPLYRETRDRVPSAEFGVDRSRYRAIDAMAFIRVFGVSVEWLTDEYFTSYDIDSKYGLCPADVVWSGGCVTNEKNTVGYAWWGIPWDFNEDDWEGAEWCKDEGELVSFGLGEASTSVKAELLDGVERLTGREYRGVDVGDVAVHGEHDDMPVLIYDESVPGRFMIAPRITS